MLALAPGFLRHSLPEAPTLALGFRAERCRWHSWRERWWVGGEQRVDGEVGATRAPAVVV